MRKWLAGVGEWTGLPRRAQEAALPSAYQRDCVADKRRRPSLGEGLDDARL
ncbi:MAG: hypothetical protein AAFW00_07185 [Bacteroidota bacterium]